MKNLVSLHFAMFCLHFLLLFMTLFRLPTHMQNEEKRGLGLRGIVEGVVMRQLTINWLGETHTHTHREKVTAAERPPSCDLPGEVDRTEERIEMTQHIHNL